LCKKCLPKVLAELVADQNRTGTVGRRACRQWSCRWVRFAWKDCRRSPWVVATGCGSRLVPVSGTGSTAAGLPVPWARRPGRRAPAQRGRQRCHRRRHWGEPCRPAP